MGAVVIEISYVYYNLEQREGGRERGREGGREGGRRWTKTNRHEIKKVRRSISVAYGGKVSVLEAILATVLSNH